MIQRHDHYAVTSTVGGDKIAMGIRVEDMAHIMGVLTDLYSNKLLAVIREYSTNALDAHREAGVTRPIEVILPNGLTPTLTIRDYGAGLSEEEIRSIYSQYGRSTKRESNDVVGMLGLGCKSALTYCSQFTVTSVRDGVRTVVLVSRESDGSGAMTPVSADATDEPSGTTVAVPIQRGDHQRAASEAHAFFRVWEEGSVLVNGTAPTRFDGLRVTDDIYVVKDGGSHIVMGNVPYPAPELDDLSPMGEILALVPIGAVDFPPSREHLMDTKATRETIVSIRERFAEGAKRAVQREIDKAESPSEAIQLATEWSQYLPGGTAHRYRYAARRIVGGPYFYKGDQLPEKFAAPEGSGELSLDAYPWMLSSNTQYHTLGRADNVRSVSVSDFAGTVWVENFSPAKYNAQHKRKMQKAAHSKGFEGVTQFVCTAMTFDRNDPAMKFIDQARFLDWTEVKKVQLEPRASRYNPNAGRIPGSYDVWTETGFKSGIPGDKLRVNDPIYYYNGNRYESERYVKVLKENHKRFTLVCLAVNRIEKFKRNVPQVEQVREGVRKLAEAWAAGLSEDTLIALRLHDTGWAVDFAVLDPERVDDDDIKRAIRLAKMNVKFEQDRQYTFSRVTQVSLREVECENPLTAYPLFDVRVLKRHPDHVYWYLNNAPKVA